MPGVNKGDCPLLRHSNLDFAVAVALPKMDDTLQDDISLRSPDFMLTHARIPFSSTLCPGIESPIPHFSPGYYCSGGFGHVYCVALPRVPRRTVE